MKWQFAAATASSILVAALLVSPAAGARTPDLSEAAGSYKISSSSRIAFVVDQVGGGGIAGAFRKFSGTFRIDGNDVGRSSVELTLYPESVATKEQRMEDFLRSSAVFNAAAYPTVTFRSTKVTQTGPDTAVIIGMLTARGITRQEKFTIRLTDWDRNSIAFDIKGDVYRSRYGMDVGTPIYLNVVKFDMDIKGQKR